MPNWCSNRLTVTGDPGKIAEIEKHALAGTLLNYIVPMPAALMDTVKGGFSDDKRQKALEEQIRQNVEQYGYPTWYEFALANWGTKWDIGENADAYRDEDREVTIWFNTAWCPPIEAYMQLCDQEGIDSVEGTWIEEGCGFCGVFQDGSLHEVEIAEYTEEWVEENLPTAVLQDFGDGLYENIAMERELEEE